MIVSTSWDAQAAEAWPQETGSNKYNNQSYAQKLKPWDVVDAEAIIYLNGTYDTLGGVNLQLVLTRKNEPSFIELCRPCSC